MEGKVEVILYQIIQNTQSLGTDNEHTEAKVFFVLNNLPFHCIVRQPHGGDHSYENDPLEVEVSSEVQRLVNYGQLRDIVEIYYKGMIGENGQGIKVSGNNITMKNNILAGRQYKELIDRGVDNSGAW